MLRERAFLSLDRPAVLTAADWLIDQARTPGVCDFGEWIVVVPGGRGGRLLLRALAARCRELGLGFLPPTITTVHTLPDLFVQQSAPWVSDWLRPWIWGQVLAQQPLELLERLELTGPSAGSPPTIEERWHLGRFLSRAHAAVASAGYTVEAVAALATENQAELAAIWTAFSRVDADYRSKLKELGLGDRLNGWIEALVGHQLACTRPIALLGLVDLSPLMIRILDAIASPITPLVIAPSDWAERFTAWGMVVPEVWAAAEVAMDESQWSLATDPADASRRVAQSIRDAMEGDSLPPIVIGCPDERLEPLVAGVLARHGVPTHSGVETPLLASPHAQLLSDFADYIRFLEYSAFATLIRHPDWGPFLAKEGIAGTWLGRLDRFAAEHLPARFGVPEWEDAGVVDIDESILQLNQIFRRIVDEFAPTELPLSVWAERLSALCVRIWGDDVLQRASLHDRIALESLEAIAFRLQSMRELPPNIDERCSGADAIGWLLRTLEDAGLPSDPGGDALELLGWLELPLDPAPELVVIGLNEGIVPSADQAAGFLDESLRTLLDMDSETLRFARDKYLLAMLLASRANCHLWVFLRDAQDAPLRPSRLLFATSPETIVARWRRIICFSDDPPVPQRFGEEAKSALQHAIPSPPETPRSVVLLAVSAFRAYLACPYRYYLEHVLRLRTVEDAAEEMEATHFGTLAHRILQDFGQSEFANSPDPVTIRGYLLNSLDHRSRELFGNRPKVAVKLQIRQLALRLSAFAEAQARQIEEGWRIHLVEQSPGEAKVHLPGANPPLQLIGRIDRIDLNVKTGAWRLMDYKTSSKARKPRDAHYDGKKWIDLQLPLYRHLAAALDAPSELSFAYFQLPAKRAEVGVQVADWTAEELAAADAEALRIVNLMRAGRFWPPSDVASRFDPWSVLVEATADPVSGSGLPALLSPGPRT